MQRTFHSNNSPFLVFTISIFILVFGYKLFTQGIFGDAIFYGATAQNLANGVGDYWHLTNSGHPILGAFYGHPPLGVWLLSYAMLFLDQVFWTERFFSLLNLVLLLYGLSKIWQVTNPQQSYSSSWWVWALWLSLPLNIWSFQQYILENTMVVFIVWAVYFGILSLQKTSYLALSFMGFFLFLATLTKGPVGLFPLAFFLVYYWVFRTSSLLKSLLLTSLLGGLLIGFYAVLLQVAPDAITYFKTYLEIQLFENIGPSSSSITAHFYLLKLLLIEPLGLWIFALFTWIAYKNKWKNISSNLQNNQWAFCFLLLTLAGTLPIMLSSKQSRFYIVPALPFLALSIAHFSFPLLQYWSKQYLQQPQRAKQLYFLSAILSLIGLSISGYRYGHFSRDQIIIEDVQAISTKLPKPSRILVRSFTTAYAAECYFVRIGKQATSNYIWAKTKEEEKKQPTPYIALDKKINPKLFPQYQKDTSLATHWLDLYSLKEKH